MEVLRFDREYEPRITVLEGSVRSGKSYINNLLWIRHLRQFQGQKKYFIMTGNTLSSLRRNVLEDLSRIAGETFKMNSYNEFQMLGNTVACFGGENAVRFQSMKGFTAYGWYANEITEQHPNTFRQAMLRCSGEGARMFWDTNPSGPDHYIKKEFIDRSGELLSSGKLAVKSWHFHLDSNTFLDAEYVESIKKSIPQGSTWYQRDILGLWVSSGNVIYSHYVTSGRYDGLTLHERADSYLNEFDELIGGVDFGRGGSSPFAFLLIGRNGNSFSVLEEGYRSSCLNREFIDEVESMLNSMNPKLKKEIVLYGDSADPDKIQEWRNAGFLMLNADKSPHSVVAGIETVMAHELIISSGCRNTLNEIGRYEWMTDGDGRITDRPVKYRDHCMDAMRYAIYSHLKRNKHRDSGTGGGGGFYRKSKDSWIIDGRSR